MDFGLAMLHPDGSYFGEIVVLQLNHTRVEAVFSFHTNTFALPQLSPEVRVAEPPNGASQAGITGSGASAAEILCTWRVDYLVCPTSDRQLTDLPQKDQSRDRVYPRPHESVLIEFVPKPPRKMAAYTKCQSTLFLPVARWVVATPLPMRIAPKPQKFRQFLVTNHIFYVRQFLTERIACGDENRRIHTKLLVRALQSCTEFAGQ